MNKDTQKESEIQEEGFDEEMHGPRKSRKAKTNNAPPDAEQRGPSTAFYLHSFLLFCGRFLNMLLDAYNRLLELTPKDKATIYRNLSTHYINKGLHDKALEHLQEWVRLEPSNPNAHYQLGNALAASGNNERAISAFNKVLTLKPQHKGALYRKSALFLKIKDFDKAAKGFKSLVDLTPENPRVYYLLGIAYDGLGKIDKAIEVMQKGVELDPKEIKYQQHLGFLNARKGDHKTAAKYFTEVMELERELEEEEEEY